MKNNLDSSERNGKKTVIGSHYRALGEDEKAEQEMFMQIKEACKTTTTGIIGISICLSLSGIVIRKYQISVKS